ncbi:MAG: undecaprenyl-phosphate glucose phosphotransferase [Planctomycetota bacterium]
MLKRHHQIAASSFAAADLAGVALCWMAAYVHKFDATFDVMSMLAGRVDATHSSWEMWGAYRVRMGVCLLASFFVFKAFGFWRPRRSESLILEILDLAKGVLALVVSLTVAAFWDRSFSASREFVLEFALWLTLWLGLTHALGRSLLRKLRRRGFNLRHVLIVGAGMAGRQVLAKIRDNRWTGLKPVGFADDSLPTGADVDHVTVLGRLDEVAALAERFDVDQVLIALPREEQARLGPLMDQLSTVPADVRIVPDLTDLKTLRVSVEELDGLPLISLQDTPLVGWNRVLKRIFDLVVGSMCLVVFGPVMIVIAFLVKRTSPGPVFYRQERMGLDGKTFEILKFRSMRVDAEKETGAVWAKADDDRRTPIGAFLRKTNLDELPQLLNVLMGHMSLVGPRPERPVFIDDFKKSIPKYMLRHKMKAGMTGWAQVNGWRGNTDLATRIQYDLYYIENWSLGFDIRILFMQLFSWRSKNAY